MRLPQSTDVRTRVSAYVGDMAGSPPSPPFGPILCAVDGSRSSAVAVQRAIALATPGGELALIAVVWRVGVGPTERALLSPEHGAEALADAAGLGAAAGVRCEQLLEHAPAAADAILSHARGHGLLVLGAAPVSRASGILSGSVASIAVHRAPGPVLLARGPIEAPRFPQRIVVASDGSLEAQLAVGATAELARARDAHVTLVHAQEEPDAGGQLEDELRLLRDGLASEPLQVTVTGHPHEAISRFAAEDGADLLVIGSRGLRGARALGSTSERVAHDAPMSVLVMRPVPEPDAARLARAQSARELAARLREHALEERFASGRLALEPSEQ